VFRPPVVEGCVRPSNESQGVVAHLAIRERHESFVDLYYGIRLVPIERGVYGSRQYILLCDTISTRAISLISVIDAIGWFNRIRAWRMLDSSRRTTGRPVPKLILFQIFVSIGNIRNDPCTH
jgi:hypothetical protein